MRLRRVVLLATVAIVALCASASDATAQSPLDADTIPPGSRVRVWVAGEVHVGRLVAVREDSVLLAVSDRGEVRAFARGEVGRVEMSNDAPSNMLRSGAIGAVVGGAAGAAIGYLAVRESSPRNCPDPNSYCNAFSGMEEMFGLIIGGIVGALTGGAIGVYVGRPREGWALPGTDRRQGSAAAGAHSRVIGISASLAF